MKKCKKNVIIIISVLIVVISSYLFISLSNQYKIKSAKEYYVNGEYVNALSLYEQINTKNIDILTKKAICQLKTSKFESCLKTIDLIEQNPKFKNEDNNFYYYKIKCYYLLEQYEYVIDLYKNYNSMVDNNVFLDKVVQL